MRLPHRGAYITLYTLLEAYKKTCEIVLNHTRNRPKPFLHLAKLNGKLTVRRCQLCIKALHIKN